MRRLFGILFLSLLMLGYNGIRQACGETIFSDNFDSYQQQLFPFPGSWELIRNGAGNAEQYVDTLNCVSNTKSLHLAGSSCWSACAYHAVTLLPPRVALPPKVTLTANVRIGQNVACGCGPALAQLAMFNPTIGLWGTGFGGVSFNCDGYIYGGNDGNVDKGGNVRLMPYMPNTWYNVRIDLDMYQRVSSVYIDGVLKASGVQINSSVTGVPTGVVLCGGYAINNPDWYDDVCVLDILTPTPTPSPTPCSAATLSEGLFNIPNIHYSTLSGTIGLWMNMQWVSQCSPPDTCFKITAYGAN
jgi:hypothetical protein